MRLVSHIAKWHVKKGKIEENCADSVETEHENVDDNFSQYIIL
jgi:hypothetical protein